MLSQSKATSHRTPVNQHSIQHIYITKVKFFNKNLTVHLLSLKYIHTTTTITILRPFVQDYLSELVPEETFTHSHLSWSSIILYQLPPPTINHSILPVQFTCLTLFFTTSLQVLFGLPLAWHPPLHTPYISSPNHCLLFTAHAHTIAACFAVVPYTCTCTINPQQKLGLLY